MKNINKISYTYAHWLYLVIFALACPLPVINVVPFALFLWRGIKKARSKTVNKITGYYKSWGFTCPEYEEVVPNGEQRYMKALLAGSYFLLCALCVYANYALWGLEGTSEAYNQVMLSMYYVVFAIVSCWTFGAILNHIKYLREEKQSTQRNPIRRQPVYTEIVREENASRVEETAAPKPEPYTTVVEYDPFIKEKFIRGRHRDCLVRSSFQLDKLYVNLEFRSGQHYLEISVYRYSVPLDGRELQILLDNGEIITLNEFTYAVKDTTQTDYSFVLSPITDAQVLMLACALVEKWRVVNKQKVVENISGPIANAAVFNSFCIDYYNTVDKFFPDRVKFAPVEEEDEDEGETAKDAPCYVYLMEDTANGYHKIGISNNPHYREHTLQSEKPTIEMLCAKEFPSRTFAFAIEQALHKKYADKRLRGEWFDLNEKDVEDLKNQLK